LIPAFFSCESLSQADGYATALWDTGTYRRLEKELLREKAQEPLFLMVPCGILG